MEKCFVHYYKGKYYFGGTLSALIDEYMPGTQALNVPISFDVKYKLDGKTQEQKIDFPYVISSENIEAQQRFVELKRHPYFVYTTSADSSLSFALKEKKEPEIENALEFFVNKYAEECLAYKKTGNIAFLEAACACHNEGVAKFLEQNRILKRSDLIQSIRKCGRMMKWKDLIRERDKICVECGAPGQEIDHIFELSKIVDKEKISTLEEATNNDNSQLWDIANGRFLCTACHRKR